MRWLIPLLLVGYWSCHGQVSSNEGRFSVDFNRGCAPLTVNVNEDIPFVGADLQYFYEGDEVGTQSLTYTYTVPGVYNLVQLVGDDTLDPKTDTLVVEVFEPITPNFDYTLCSRRDVQVTIDDQSYPDYEVTFAGSSSVILKDQEFSIYTFGLGDPLSIQVRGLLPNAANNCPEVRTVIPNVIDDLQPPLIQSSEIVQFCENQFGLNLMSSPDEDVLYEIELSRSNAAFESIWQGELTNDFFVPDMDFNSQETSYCLRIIANNVCDGSRIIGQGECRDLESGDLDPVKNLFSSYQGNDILISMDETTLGEFRITRSFDQNSYSNLITTDREHVDETGFRGRQYFYQVSYLDTCDGEWGVKQTAPPFIRASEIDKNRFSVTLTTAEHNLEETFVYQGTLTGNGKSEVFDVTTNPFEVRLFPDLGDIQTLVVSGQSSSTIVQSNPISFEFEFLIYVPKAFTPNGDGLNDRLEFFGLGQSLGELRIYTRWGQQVYGEISSAPSWDGRIDGRRAVEGVYIYEISIPEMSNHVQKGTFALINK